jgi:hypothetical protein
VANGANAVGFVLGGALLDVLSVRATVVLVGAFGLLVTAGFAVPMVRASEAGGVSVPTVEPGVACEV